MLLPHKRTLPVLLACVLVFVLASYRVTVGRQVLVHFGAVGWEGCAGPPGDTLSASFAVPHVSGGNGRSAALWTGFGDGRPGSIDQAGFTMTERGGITFVSGWYELWPAPAHPLGGVVHAGDQVSVLVRDDGGPAGAVKFSVTIRDVTRHWAASHAGTAALFPDFQGEAVAEGYGPPLAHMQATLLRLSFRPGKSYTGLTGYTAACGTHSMKIRG